MSESKNHIKELENIVFEINDKFDVKNRADAATLQRLTKSLTEGDSQAWEELYLLLYDPVAAFIKHIVRSKEEASDLAQEVFIKLWENVSKIDPEKNIRAYVYAIARSLSYNHLRSRIKERGLTPDEYNVELPALDFSPEELAIGEELKLLIAMALETMPPQRKLVFEMSRLEGLSKDEIAKKLGISNRTVGNHLYIALKDLKELLFLAAVLLMVSNFGFEDIPDNLTETDSAIKVQNGPINDRHLLQNTRMNFHEN